MEKQSNTLLEKGKSSGVSSAFGIYKPFIDAGKYAGKKLWNWGRGAYKKWKKSQNDKEKVKAHKDYMNYKRQQQQKQQKQYSDDDIKQKAKNAQDNIRNQGMFEPEVYEAHKFYKTTIFDELHPDENNFVYLSKNQDGSKAYQSFLDYYKNKFVEKKHITDPKEINNFIKSVKERFKTDTNRPVYISVPQYYIIDNDEVLYMAKNSDIIDKEKTVYYDRPTFDSNYIFDVHMYQNKNEDVEDDVDEYKTSLISFNLFDTDYVCACEPGIDVDLSVISGSVILSLGQELMNDDDDKLYKFSKIVERMVDTEQKRTNVYCVATPLLIKDARTAHDLEYNACLLDGLNLYESEEEFKDNYLEEYQKLINNQMGL